LGRLDLRGDLSEFIPKRGKVGTVIAGANSEVTLLLEKGSISSFSSSYAVFNWGVSRFLLLRISEDEWDSKLVEGILQICLPP